ncbi:hypothetical protein, partial [Nonlabens sp.]|uniref:hypothetical protein n=1 Tax=Nonlabens sp. TaxID=1888209 RepID=UPI001BCB2EB6
DELEIIYLVESKGEHLLGNNDTTYKNSVFQKMTEQHKKGNLNTYQIELEFDKLNESVEAYLIEGEQEEQKLKELMK